MIAMSPRGSGMPSYAPHRDMLYRMRAWVQGAGMANLRAQEGKYTEEEINKLNIVAVAIVDLTVACQQRAITIADLPARMDAIFEKYPEAYAVVLHETFKALFTQYRTFIAEVCPPPTDPPSNDSPAQALLLSEEKVADFIAKGGQ